MPCVGIQDEGHPMKLAKILVGIDFSAESDKALAHAEAVARTTGAELILAHAGHMLDAADEALALEAEAFDRYRQLVAKEHAESHRLLQTMTQELTARGLVARECLLDGYADSAIADAAEEEQAELIAIGTHGRSGLRRVFLGSVAEKVVRRSDRQVLVARGEAPTGGYRRILAAVDFSPVSARVLDTAIGLAGETGQVDVFYAWNLPALRGGLLPVPASEAALKPVRKAMESGARAKIDELLAAHSGTDNVTVTIVNEPATKAIAERAEDGHDLIVMGGQGHRGWRRWVLGSVAEATVRHAPCSVWVVRKDDQARAK